MSVQHRLPVVLGLSLLIGGAQFGSIAETTARPPQLKPDVDGTLGPVAIEVHPQTKRALVPATVNGVAGRFLVDTGLSDTILDPAFAGKAGVTNVEVRLPIVAGNSGEKGESLEFVRVPDLEIAGTHFRNFHAVLQSTQRPRRDFPAQLDGVIGANVLFAKPITFDFRRQRLIFASDAARPHEFTFELLRNRRKTAPEEQIREVSSPTPVFEVELDGVKVALLLDTGASIGDLMVVNEPYHAALRKLAGDPKASQYTAKEVRVAGKLLLANQRCRLLPFAETVIGSAFFDRYVIAIDMAAGTGWIDHHPAPAPASSPPAPPGENPGKTRPE